MLDYIRKFLCRFLFPQLESQLETARRISEITQNQIQHVQSQIQIQQLQIQQLQGISQSHRKAVESLHTDLSSVADTFVQVFGKEGK
jgi:flagellar biosynthesis chaperone FliJ